MTMTTNRDRLLDRARELYATAESENRALTDEESTEFDELENRVAELDRHERSIMNMPALNIDNGSTNRAAVERPADPFGDVLEGRAAHVTLPALERALSTGGSTAGAEHVLVQAADRFHMALSTASALFTAASKLPTGQDHSDIALPQVTGFATADQEMAEAGTITADDLTTAATTFGVYRYTSIQNVSNQILGSGIVALDRIVPEALGRSLAVAFGPRLAVGTGSSQPEGITVGAGAGVTAAATGAVTADELIELAFSVAAEYRSAYSMSWAMNDASWEAVRKLKDTDNNYLIGDLAGGAAPTLLGHPVVIDNNLPSMAASAVPIVFGAISDLFVVRTVDTRIEASRDALWANDQTSFRAVTGLDSKVIDDAGIKALTMAAS